MANQEASAKYLGVPVEITNSIGMKLRLIPSGAFIMGTPQAEMDEAFNKSEDWNKHNIKSEGPQRQVSINEPFYLGTHEVTVGQFRKFVKDKDYQTWAERTGKGGRGYDGSTGTMVLRPGFIWTSSSVANTENHPVVLLHREDVEAFCAWLSKNEGRTYRLPSEEEWEFACRAGSQTRWFWGDDPAQAKLYSWFQEPATSARQMPVGLRLPNPFGLFDMAGNVAEKTLDQKGTIVMRGGHAGYRPIQLRSGAREIENHNDPTYRNGFRVAMGVNKQK